MTATSLEFASCPEFPAKGVPMPLKAGQCEGRSPFRSSALRIVLLSVFVAGASQVSAQSAYWNMQTASPTSNTVGNLTVGSLSQGNNNGITTMLGATSPSSGYNFLLSGSSTAASGNNNAGAAARAGSLNTGSSAYFEFSLTPESGYGFTFSSIGFGSRSTSTGPKAFTLRSSVDGYTSDLITPGSLASTSTWAYSSTSLTSGTSSFTAVTYRLFGYGGTGSPSTNTANWRIDDLVLSLASMSSGGTDLYWDGGAGWNATAPGAGGSGSWADGSGSWDASKKANFGGTAGTVTAAIVTASNGLSFATTGYILSGGTITLGGASIGLNAITSGTDGTVTTTINSAVAGSAGLTKMGQGTLILGGANTFTGGLTISAGTLQISSESNLGDAAGSVNVSSTLKTTGNVSLGSGRAVSGGGTLDIAPGTTLTSSGSFGMSAVTLSNSGTLDLQGGTRSVGNLTFGTAAVVNGSGAISATGLTANSVTSGTAVVNPGITFSGSNRPVSIGAGGTLVLNGDLAGLGQLQKSGGGRLVVSGSNGTGGFSIGSAGAAPIDGGTVVLGQSQSGGTGQTFFNYGTLEAATPVSLSTGVSIGGRAGALAVLGGSNPITFSGSSRFFKATSTTGELRLDVNNSTTFSGTFGPSGGSGSATGITLGGTGSLTLNGGAALTELITLQDSLDLIVNNVLGSGVSVANGTLLGGAGTIGGAVSVLGGGILAPGTSPGTLTINNTLGFAGTSVLNFELNAADQTVGGGVNDLVAGVTNLTLDGILNVNGIGDFTTIAAPVSWRLFNYTGTLTDNGLTLGSLPTLGAGQTYSLDTTSTTGQVNLVVVPEPTLLAAGGLGLAAAVASLRRLRRR